MNKNEIWSNKKFVYKDCDPVHSPYSMIHNHYCRLINDYSNAPLVHINEKVLADAISQIPQINVNEIIEQLPLNDVQLNKPNLKTDALSKLRYSLDLDNIYSMIKTNISQCYYALSKALNNYIFLNAVSNLYTNLVAKTAVTNDEYINVFSNLDLYTELINTLDGDLIIERAPIPALIISTKHWNKLLTTENFLLINLIMYVTMEKIIDSVDTEFLTKLFNISFCKKWCEAFLNSKEKDSISFYQNSPIYYFASSNKLIMDELVNIFESETLIKSVG